MFGLFKKAYDGPYSLEANVTIDAPASTVFALIDFSSPQHHLIAQGFVFSKKVDGIGLNVATTPSLPGETFHFDVEAFTPGESIDYTSWSTGDGKVGALERSQSHCRVEALNETSCKLFLTETATFKSGLKYQERVDEEALFTMAVHNFLARLKVHAEQGPEAAAAL